MESGFAKAEMLIRRPVAEVFNAFIDPAITTRFWFTKGSATLEAGKSVQWTWEMYNVTIDVDVKEIVPNKKILIDWGSATEKNSVEWIFKTLEDGSTFVSITNSGLKGDAKQIVDQVRDSTEGFTLVLAGLKAYAEHGIQLGLVGDRFPKGVGETV